MEKKQRNSNLELFRIIMMLAIIAHHLVVNSGVTENFDYQNITGNMVFLQLFGFSGKAMINGFLLITGYFMVKSKFSFNKVVRIYLEIKFYKLIIYIVLVIIGVQDLGLKALFKSVFSIFYSAGNGFVGTFFVLYLLVPFINKLVSCLNKTQYVFCICVLLMYFTVLSTFLKNDNFSELGWYVVMYMIGGFIRLYPIQLFYSKKRSGLLAFVSLLFSYLSIIFIDVFNKIFDKAFFPYYFVINANKLFALVLAVFSFCFFKNIKIKQKKFINLIASTTLGVLLIHANSDSMRMFLWVDLFNIKGNYNMSLLPLYSVGCVMLIYITCVLIDLARIYFLEKPLFKKLNSWHKYQSVCEKIDNTLN